MIGLALVATSASALDPSRPITQFAHPRWTIEQGLPHATVRAILQTRDGYIWLATYEGLVRFNGFEFTVFARSAGSQLANDSVIALCEARDGSLWIGTNDGLTRRRGDEMVTFRKKDGLAGNRIHALAAGPDGSLWIATDGGGLSRYSNGRFDSWGPAAGLPNGTLTSLAFDADGSLWAGSTAGLVHFRDRVIGTLTAADGLADSSVAALLRDREGRILVGTTKGLNRLAGGKVERPEELAAISGESVTTLLEDRDGALWVGTYTDGLFRIANREVSHVAVAQGLTNQSVRALFEDAEGNVWIGTNGGLERLEGESFATFSRTEGLLDDYVRAVIEDGDGTVWIATAGGLSRLRDGRVTNLTTADGLAANYVFSLEVAHDGGLWIGTSKGLQRYAGGRFSLLTTRDGLANDVVRAIHQARDGTLWVGTEGGLNALGPRGGVRTYSVAAGNLPNDDVSAIAETTDGAVWVATNGGGLVRIAGDGTRVFTRADGLPGLNLWTVYAGSDGSVWIGTDGDGLARYRGGKFFVYTTKHGLLKDKIVQVIEDGRGRVWFGTISGIFSATLADLDAVEAGSRKTLRIEVFGTGDGLKSAQCNGFASPAAWRGRSGTLWFATTGGAACVDPQRLVRRISGRPVVIERILVNGEPIGPSSVISLHPGAERLEITYVGLTYSAPERIRYRYRLDGFEKQWVAAGTSRSASYTKLPPGRFEFRVEATVDGVTWSESASPVVIRVLPRFWQTPWFAAVVLLAALAFLSGIYLFRLRSLEARERELTALVEQRTLAVTEEKRRAEDALAAAEAARQESVRHLEQLEDALLDAKLARQDAEKHERMLEETLAVAEEANRAKTVFLAATSHELRTPLNAIIGFSNILLTQKRDPLSPRHHRFLENILGSGQYLLAVINNILDISKIEAGKMEFAPEPVSVPEVLEGIGEVVRGVASTRGVRLEIDALASLPRIEADRAQLKQILLNLISNAVKFSPDNTPVHVAVREVPAAQSSLRVDSLRMTVTDHGIGIDPAHHQLIFQEFQQVPATERRSEGTGLGLALVRRFVEMHGGTVEVDSALGRGATFIVTLPRAQQSTAPSAQEPSRVER